jgi:hypothetical protein
MNITWFGRRRRVPPFVAGIVVTVLVALAVALIAARIRQMFFAH